MTHLELAKVCAHLVPSVALTSDSFLPKSSILIRYICLLKSASLLQNFRPYNHADQCFAIRPAFSGTEAVHPTAVDKGLQDSKVLVSRQLRAYSTAAALQDSAAAPRCLLPHRQGVPCMPSITGAAALLLMSARFSTAPGSMLQLKQIAAQQPRQAACPHKRIGPGRCMRVSIMRPRSRAEQHIQHPRHSGSCVMSAL